MKKLLCLFLLIITFQVHVEAKDIDSYIHYTGKSAYYAADFATIIGVNNDNLLGLGGPIGNAYIVLDAYQFTVSKPLEVKKLSIDATAIPNIRVRDLLLDDYISQRLSEGATSEQINLEINGDATHPPTFVGPSQSIAVTFQIYEGTNLNGVGEYLPNFNSLVQSTDHTFTTPDSLNSANYSDVKIPFKADLNPGNTYWIAAQDPQYSGVTLDYNTEFKGRVATPEPPICLFFIFLIGFILWRGRKNVVVE